MKLSRSSGILLHPTALPDGRLDEHAYAFVDWLAAAGQSWWQVLPLGPPDEVGSPYKSASAFAGWSGLLADPTADVEPEELEAFVAREAYWIESADHVSHPQLFLTDVVAGVPPDALRTTVNCGGTRSSTGRRFAHRASAGGSSASAARSTSST